MSDSDNSSDWDGVDIDQTASNTRPLTLPQNPKVKKLDDMTSFLTSAAIALPQMQQVPCGNGDDNFDEFDDFERADEIKIPPSVQIKSNNAVDFPHNRQLNNIINMNGNKSGPTLITMDHMASLMTGHSAASLQSMPKHTRYVSEVSEEECLVKMNDDNVMAGFDDVADGGSYGAADTVNDKLKVPQDDKIIIAREVQRSEVGDQSAKLEQDTEDVAQKKDKNSQSVIAHAAGTNSLLSAYAGKEEDEDNWDNEFDLSGSVTGQQLLRGPSSRPPPSSPLLRQALTNSSNNGSNNAMAVVYRKQSSPINAQGKTKMTLFTLPTNSVNSISKNGNNSHKIHLHTLPSPTSANGCQGGGMVYDAEQQKWIETGDASAHEEVDWGSDDDDVENTSGKNTASGGVHVNGGTVARGTAARLSPPPPESQSHERASSHADFEISADLKASLLASEAHHHYLFNSFLGPKEYAHYIDKISRSQSSCRPATAWAAKTSSTVTPHHKRGESSKMASSAGVWPINGKKTARSGMTPSPNTSVRGRGSEKASKSTSQGRSKQDIKHDVSQYKIPSATKIGSRKHHMLTEIWEEFSKK